MEGTRDAASCFVSHCYGDEAMLAACLQHMPEHGLEPFVFPPTDVTPDEAISENLISAIRSCPRFVYLDTVRSRGSFWVGFERNIAARLGKPVLAFHPKGRTGEFVCDDRRAADPVVSILLNMAIPEDVERIQLVRAAIWDRYAFEIRGDKWRRIDNDARQMLDSVDGIRKKYDAGGVTLLFLSNASIAGGFHDYLDPASFRRAQKDMETPHGYTGEKFAVLDPARTVVLWLDEPDLEAIDMALARIQGAGWEPYVRIIRRALTERVKLIAFQDGKRLHLNHLDTMLARALAVAIDSDARIAAEFRCGIASTR